MLAPEWEAAFAELSDVAFSFYREHILDDPEVLQYFEEATPVANWNMRKSVPARHAAEDAAAGRPSRDSLGLWLDPEPAIHSSVVRCWPRS